MPSAARATAQTPHRRADAPGRDRPGGMPARQALVLGGLAAAVAAASAADVLPWWPGLAHLVALPPLDLFTDLRVLVPAATGHLTLLASVVAAVGLRTLVLALLLGGLDRRRLAFALHYYLVVLPFALVSAFATYAAHAGLYSGLHWIGMAIALLALVVLAAAPWTGRTTLRDALRASGWGGSRVWATCAYVVALTIIGGAGHLAGPPGWFAAVPASAALTLGALWWLSRPARTRPGLRLASFGAAVVAAAVALVVGAGAAPEPAPGARDGSLLAMSGMNSASGEGAILEVDHPTLFGYSCEQVYYASYAGPGPGQPQGEAVCPIRTGAPYTNEDTRKRPFDEQVDLLARQVDEQIPAPVTLIAHSQGAWVAWHAAANGLLDDVETLVVIGPFPGSALGWPPPGEPGPGRVGADALQALGPLARLITFDFGPYEPIARDVLETANVPRSIYAQPLPEDLRVLSVFGVGDLPLNPGGWRLDGAVNACPVLSDHPDLPHAGDTQRQVAAFLDGEALPECPRWRTAVHPLSLPWAPPPADGAAAYDP